MTVTYTPLPLLATTGTVFVQMLTIVALQQNDSFAALDLSDYSDLHFVCDDLDLSETTDQAATGLYRMDDAAGELQVRISSAQLDGFTLLDGLDYTPFDWLLTGVYIGGTDLTEIGSGELRISAGA